MTSNIKLWKRDFTDEELPLLRPVQEYVDGAKAAVQALGGAEKAQELVKEAPAKRGANLWSAK